MLRKTVDGLARFIGLSAATLFFAGISYAQAPPQPWAQCPPVGFAKSCRLMIVINADLSVSIYAATNPTVPAYDSGSEDTLVGIVNKSSQAIASVALSGIGAMGKGIFAFDTDGICDTTNSSGDVPPPYPPGCPYGPTGYEGPGVSFTVSGGLSKCASGQFYCATDPFGATSGSVDFSPPLAPNASGYFALEDMLSPENIKPPKPPTPAPAPAPTPTGVTLRTIITTDTVPADCSGAPTPVSVFAPTAAKVVVYFLLDGVQLSDVVADNWVTPQNSSYYSGPWNAGSGSRCYSDYIDVAGKNAASLPGVWTIQVSLNGKLLTTVQFTITASLNLPRVGLFSHVVGGNGWTSALTLENTSSSTVTLNVIFRADDGTAVSLPLKIISQGTSRYTTASSVTTSVNPNATLRVETANQYGDTMISGWADVQGTGPINGYGIFRYYSAGSGTTSEGTLPMQTAFPAKLIMPYDNTSGFRAAGALVNLSTATATISATLFDDKGNQLGGPQTFTLPGNGHEAFFIDTSFTATKSNSGIVVFSNGSGSGTGGIGVRFSPQATFTSVPVVIQ
jgi:hypothetical protein